MNHFIITKVFIDNKDDAYITNRLFFDEQKALFEFLAMKDEIKAKVAFKYSVPFEEFDINDFASEVIDTNSCFVYKDFEGQKNIKIELQRISPNY